MTEQNLLSELTHRVSGVLAAFIESCPGPVVGPQGAARVVLAVAARLHQQVYGPAATAAVLLELAGLCDEYARPN